jgi:3-oxoacyl-(acyl-carrier-protein) synthase/surfactin synthase thioesterase subunit/acyl carrier protein
MTDQSTLQKALFTIKKLKYLLQEKQTHSEPIAIIGLSCRYPEAVGKENYWRMLTEGRNAMSKIPEERWALLKGSDEITLRQHDHPYWGSYLADIAAFDAYFFGISPREAARMDPQHRLLLEVAYEAIEDAGLPVESLAGSNTGVFSSLYVSQLAHLQTLDNDMDALYLPTGNAISIAANRLSYLLDLHGPSIIVDSACSSSMASLHLACQNIRSQACDIALVCGAKMNLLPYVNYVLTKAKMLSPDGQCKTFDADANGYAAGEGIGVVVLKSLTNALKDNDRIYGVITGSAVNQDGKTNGLTAPNGLQQENLLKAAYQAAKIEPQDISYVECHGTGTFLGDPIEIQALGSVVGKKRESEKPCWIGSVKTNIGHLEPAAGIASVIKVALAIKEKKIPPHLNFHTPNPHIAFDKYHLRIPTALQDWPKYGEYRAAGISGFGFGGTNAHIVMRELTEIEIPSTIVSSSKPELFTLSAKDTIALSLLIDRWCSFFENNPTADLAQLSYSVHLRRSHYTHRLAVIAASTSELYNLLCSVRQQSLESITNTESIFINIGKNKFVATKTPENITAINITQLAELYINRTPVNWKQYEAERTYPHCDMPLYPWQHKNYWPPLGIKHTVTEDADNLHPLRGKRVNSPLHTIQFDYTIDKKLIPDLEDTYNIVHAGYYLEMLTFAVNSLSGQVAFTIENHEFMAPLIASNNNIVKVQIILEKSDDTHFNYYFHSNTLGQKKWLLHAKGKLTLGATLDKKIDSIADIQNRCKENGTAATMYERIVGMGMPAGETIRWTQQYWQGENEILCEFHQPPAPRKNEEFILKIHPGIMDASIQPLFKLLPAHLTSPYIASSAGKMKFYGLKNGPYFLLGSLANVTESGDKMTGNCWLINAESEVIAEFENINLTQLDNNAQIDKLMESKNKHNLDMSSLLPEERKIKITDFLIEQVAIIFAMPKEDIKPDYSLKNMGIDSLMALVLMRTLELGLGATYSMEALLDGPTIHELADFVISATVSVPTFSTNSTPKKSTPWLRYHQPQKNPEARLFCFPYGGGGASIYRDWQRDLPETIEVCPIQLPGREERMNEKPIHDIETLIDLLIENLHNKLDLPFAFFGHSYGSLVGFELTRTLRKRNLPLPKHLFASAFPDPRIPTKSLDTLLAQLSAVNINLLDITTEAAIEKLSDVQLRNLSNIFNENGIADYGDHLMNKDVIKVLLPIFIGDMSIAKNYQYRDEAPLDLPITVFLGKRDTWVAYEDHFKWVEHTSKVCDIHEFDSGHLFIKDGQIKQKLLQIITQKFVTVQEHELANA